MKLVQWTMPCSGITAKGEHCEHSRNVMVKFGRMPKKWFCHAHKEQSK